MSFAPLAHHSISSAVLNFTFFWWCFRWHVIQSCSHNHFMYGDKILNFSCWIKCCLIQLYDPRYGFLSFACYAFFMFWVAPTSLLAHYNLARHQIKNDIKLMGKDDFYHLIHDEMRRIMQTPTHKYTVQSTIVRYLTFLHHRRCCV